MDYDKEKMIISDLERFHEKSGSFRNIIEDELELVFKTKQEKGRNMRAWFSWGIISILLIFGFIGGLFAFIPQLSAQDTGVTVGNVTQSTSKLYTQNTVTVAGLDDIVVYNLTTGGEVLVGFVLASLAFGSVLASTFALVDKLEEDKEEVEIAEKALEADLKMAQIAHAGDKKLAHEVAKVHDEINVIKSKRIERT